MKVSELKVIDVILMPEFEQGMGICLNEIKLKRGEILATGVEFKRGPIDVLKEKGLFNAKSMVILYKHALNKSLDTNVYSSNVRKYITQIGDAVLHRLIEYLKAKEEKIETIMVKKENKDDKITGIIVDRKDIIK